MSQLDDVMSYSPDLRRDARVVTSIAAILVVDDVSFDCLIRDLSTGGAKIYIDPKHKLGSTLKLIVHELDLVFHCELRWRYDRAAGLKFLSSESLDSQPRRPTREQLLAQIDDLKATVTELTMKLDLTRE